MYDDERQTRRFYAVSAKEDTGVVSRGGLIPKKVVDDHTPPPEVKEKKPGALVLHTKPLLMVTMPLFILLVGSMVASYDLLRGESVVASPIVMVENSSTRAQEPLTYGAQVALTDPDFFEETRDSFVVDQQTFIEVDLTTMTLGYYDDGIRVFAAPILEKGEKGSWWETPAGLYKVNAKKEDHFSSTGGVYHPYNLSFQGNFSIHGWPYFSSGEIVEPDFFGGCIQLDDIDAATLYELVPAGTPVLVHEQKFASDNFVYESKVPEINTPHYLIADINSNTVIASSDLKGTAPIASITKLMTALMAAEYIDLDSRVQKHQENFVESLIPRLDGRSQVSMYSLLQLLLVESSNEAAEVIAAQVGREEFIMLMNEKAKILGLEDTVFVDPSGVGSENISSLEDLLRLTQYIYHNRSFIFELTKDQDIPTLHPSGEFGELQNFNDFNDIDNFVGGKIGETTAAGQTSISLHSVKINDEERIIAVIILGSSSRTADVKQLLEYVDRRFGD